MSESGNDFSKWLPIAILLTVVFLAFLVLSVPHSNIPIKISVTPVPVVVLAPAGSQTLSLESSSVARVSNAKIAFDAFIAANPTAVASSAADPLYFSDSNGAISAPVDPLTGLAFFKVNPDYIINGSTLKDRIIRDKRGNILPGAEFFSGESKAKVYYGFSSDYRVLYFFVDLHSAKHYLLNYLNHGTYSGRIDFETIPTFSLPSVRLTFNSKPGYLLYSPKVVIAKNKGQPIYAVNNLPINLTLTFSATVTSSRRLDSGTAVFFGTYNEPRYGNSLSVESWYSKSFWTVLSDSDVNELKIAQRDAFAVPETFAVSSANNIDSSTCINRLCTCDQLRKSIGNSGGHAYFGLFDSLKNDPDAYKVLQEAYFHSIKGRANPHVDLLIRGQLLGDHCYILNQYVPTETRILQIVYSVTEKKVHAKVFRVFGSNKFSLFGLYSDEGIIETSSSFDKYRKASIELSEFDHSPNN